MDTKNVDAIYVRGMSLYYQDNVDKAFTHFQHVLKSAPDHKRALDIYKVCMSGLRDEMPFILIMCDLMTLLLTV